MTGRSKPHDKEVVLESKQNKNEFLEILSIIWDKKKLISLLVLFFSCVGFIYAFYIATPLYSSSVTFYLNSNNESSDSQLLNLASQFGIGGVRNTKNSLNVLDITTSRRILGLVVEKEWENDKYPNKKMNLIEYWGIEESEPWILREHAISRALEHVSVHKNNDTGLITITMQAEEAQLSADIVNFITKTVSDYIKAEIKNRSTLSLDFIEQRLLATKQELTLAENELQAFREKNRNTTNSPALILTGVRLERNVAVKQEVFIALEQQKEIELIEGTKDEVPFTVLDFGEKPIRHSSPNRTKIILAFFLGSFVMLTSLVLLFSKKKTSRIT